MSGFQTDLLTGLAVYLAGAGIGATWKPAASYGELETGIRLGAMPDSPDRMIVLSAYDVSHSPTLSDSFMGLQVRCRWNGKDPRPVDDLQDAIFNLLHGQAGLTLSTGVFIVQCLRQSAASLGQDQNSRWGTSANYYLLVHRPSTHRA